MDAVFEENIASYNIASAFQFKKEADPASLDQGFSYRRVGHPLKPNPHLSLIHGGPLDVHGLGEHNSYPVRTIFDPDSFYGDVSASPKEDPREGSAEDQILHHEVLDVLYAKGGDRRAIYFQIAHNQGAGNVSDKDPKRIAIGIHPQILDDEGCGGRAEAGGEAINVLHRTDEDRAAGRRRARQARQAWEEKPKEHK